MEFKDYYKVLDVAPEATSKEIKTAYRKLARKYHPDLSDHEEAEEKFKAVAEAYEVLKDKEKRAEFDELRQYGVHGQSFTPPPGWQPGGVETGFSSYEGDFSDFFSSIFGQRFGQKPDHGSSQYQSYSSQQYSNGQPGRRGQDVETELPVFLEETQETASKTISYQLSGTEKTLNVKIPAGVTNGERIRLKGQGGPGYGDSAPNGDLYLRIRLVPHPLFDIEGHNLVTILPLSPWEAVLGVKVDVPTLDGKVRMNVPANSQSGQKLRIKGKGLINKQGRKGDLYALIKIVMPDKPNKELESLWQQLAEKSTFDPRKEWRK